MRISPFIFIGFFFLTCNTGEDTVFRNDQFVIFPDRVEQGDFSARVLSSQHMISDYQSDFQQPTKRDVYFKFSINGADNERAPGEDHRLILPLNGGVTESPVYLFGRTNSAELAQIPSGESPFLNDDATVTFRLDLRPVMAQFATTGAFMTATGETIQKADFDGVYIAGSVLPLTWEFTALPLQEKFRLTDDDGDGIFEVTLLFSKYQQAEKAAGPKTWDLAADISHYPQYSSPLPLTGALYNLSLEELVENIRPDGALMAGAKWPGVWTRDISYSIILSLAMLDPEAAKSSLLAKVKEDLIVQDTGTGGSWPISTDRVVWALAAWEVYLATGDADWLDYSYQVIRNTLEIDVKVAFNPETGLMFGESSFLDWREQTYPRWMDPKDIFRSHCLGTNALYFQAFNILIKMGQLLDEDVTAYLEWPEKLKTAINTHLWQSEAGYYGQYLYGRTFYSLSPRAETLGEALCILYGIADEDQRREIVSQMPLTTWGPACISPQIPQIPPYHNNGIWPFVTAYWTWAAADAGNTAAVEHGLASIYRAAALFLTNKENTVAETGDFMGTEINSDRQLWSVAGNLASIYRVLFGMRLSPEGLHFQPFVPKKYEGAHSIENFSWRESRLNITMTGFGNRIRQIMLDGEKIEAAVIPADLSGEHTVIIEVANEMNADKNITVQEIVFSPATPMLRTATPAFHWPAVANAAAYRIFENGRLVTEQIDTTWLPVKRTGFAEYQVQAVDAAGRTSFLSEPVWSALFEKVVEFEAEAPAPDSITDDIRFLRLAKRQNRRVSWEIDIPVAGAYGFDFHYANGNGPINTNNKCAIRSAWLDGKRIGTVVFPQRGIDAWDDWGFSNILKQQLTAGTHRFELRFSSPYDENMNRDENTAHLDYLRLIYLGGK